MSFKDDLQKEIDSGCNDDVLFHTFIRRFMKELNVSNRDVASMMDMSVPSVDRWIAGRTAPHPAMRAAVYRKLISKIE